MTEFATIATSNAAVRSVEEGGFDNAVCGQNGNRFGSAR
jgi:hypothetical protein